MRKNVWEQELILKHTWGRMSMWSDQKAKWKQYTEYRYHHILFCIGWVLRKKTQRGMTWVWGEFCGWFSGKRKRHYNSKLCEIMMQVYWILERFLKTKCCHNKSQVLSFYCRRLQGALKEWDMGQGNWAD